MKEKTTKPVTEKKVTKAVKTESKKPVKAVNPVEASFEKWFVKQEASLKEIRDVKKRLLLAYKAGVAKGKSLNK